MLAKTKLEINFRFSLKLFTCIKYTQSKPLRGSRAIRNKKTHHQFQHLAFASFLLLIHQHDQSETLNLKIYINSRKIIFNSIRKSHFLHASLSVLGSYSCFQALNISFLKETA